MNSFFSKLAHRTSQTMGSAKAFFIAVVVVLVWAMTGPLFDFSNTWQLVINTGTTIFTFLMVILIQHTQNHDSRALHLKLDELIRAVKPARNSLVDLEAMTDDELDMLQAEFRRIRERAERKKSGTSGS